MRRAASLDDALAVLAAEPGAWMPFAGGTDLMVLMEAGKLPKRRFLSLWNVDALRGVEVTTDAVKVGALATYSDLVADSTLQREFPLVCAAALETGAIAIQNRGTVGGNIANASPAADLPPALLVYDAALHLASVRGERVVPYAEFHKGYKVMDMAADELITAVTIPRGRDGWQQTLPQSGHAPGPGDFEGLFCRGNEDRCGQGEGRAHRSRKRRSDRPPLHEHGSGATWPASGRTNDQKCPCTPRPGGSTDRRHSLQRELPSSRRV